MYIRGVPRTSRQLTTTRGTIVRDGGDVPARKPATLCDRPQYLSVLWDEWIKGVDGRLAAKHFSSKQRRDEKVKHLFCHRKPFWKCMERLIDNGYTAPEALSLIEELYPGSMTQKLKTIKLHKKREVIISCVQLGGVGGHRKRSSVGRILTPEIQ